MPHLERFVVAEARQLVAANGHAGQARDASAGHEASARSSLPMRSQTRAVRAPRRLAEELRHPWEHVLRRVRLPDPLRELGETSYGVDRLP